MTRRTPEQYARYVPEYRDLRRRLYRWGEIAMKLKLSLDDVHYIATLERRMGREGDSAQAR